MANILIVDDAMVMRKKLRIVLTSAGHTVVGEAANGAEAINLYKELKPDLVTMDITMPVLDGIDAVKQIINQDKAAKIVMVSAVNQQNKVFEAIEIGAKHYVVKPINDQKFLDIIKEVLEAGTTKAKAQDNAINPFSIINNSGEFIITIQRAMDEDEIANLSKAVDGMLFINPLVVTLNMSSSEEAYSANFEKIIPIINKIKQNNGKLTINK